MNLQTKNTKKILSFALAICVLFSMIATALPFAAANAPKTLTYYKFNSPYADIDWDTYGQYKANLHTHTTVSIDSSEPVRNQVEGYYAVEYDIISINDHANTSKDWDKYTTAQGAVSAKRAIEIANGEGRDGRGMTQIPLSNEQNGLSNHVLSYFADYNAGLLASSYATTVQNVANRDGFSFFAHPGRYTSAPATQTQINNYANFFLQYPNSALGYEIFGVNDGETKNERYLWDRTLMITAPLGKNVFGIANDDAHSTSAIGRSGWTIFVMPENSVENIKAAMGASAFYASAMIAIDEGIDARNSGLPTPIISSITIDGNVISVEGDFYNTIEWIADGVKIATGNIIDLVEYKDQIGSYIRFQLIGDGGITWANPILVEQVEVDLLDAVAEASVKKVSGNQNELTITITEIYEHDKTNVLTATFMINNNAAGSYQVGDYVVYVDTKGNDQIRACYIVAGCEINIEAEADEDDIIVEANVEKTSGNTNELTITVTDASGNVVEETFTIDNNVADTYQVGDYVVYVDTKGNDQIRDYYIVQ